ncbi:protein SIEVE ELEMENT OCCLUSION C [Prunus yedoensis var. nudiflora]|uniref:Protein SIEVE ELEMENT OCCLUSION C n=1 Tax=Prunus yedoensis var. nudiflora TaxID=2094558 RepID=A0A314XMH0_PRUYE|nr:protein SIEVE ELEMENT OCCLUSION C [Prunus yedoensis var. nudiflora]
MDLLGSDTFLPNSVSSLSQEVLIKKLLLSHDPDGRHLDSELLLCAVEDIMLCTTTSQVLDATEKTHVCNMEFESQEPLRQTFCEISHEILCKCCDEGSLHARTMLLFDLLGNYKWGAKVALVLTSFVASYGEFRLLMQLYSSSPLAISVAMLKKLPADSSPLNPRFKALSLLVNAMVDVTKCIIKFENLPLSHVELDDETKAVTKSQIYIAVYWIIRGILICSSQITDSTAMKSEQYSDSTIIASWELLSLVYQLRSIYSDLRQQVEVCHQQTETKLYQKLLDIFKETQVDNQELGVSDLKNEAVILLISKPELLSIEESLFLVQQTHNHPHKKNAEDSYRIVWVPIPVSNQWTDAEETIFEYLSNSLPWFSIRQPWLLNSAVVKFIKEAWNYKNEPVMVVLDSQGTVTNPNAIDMLFIWGPKACPFSASREEELWQEQNWTLQFMMDEIDLLLTKWVEEGRNICIYGSDSIDWIVEFTDKMEIIKSAGVQLELVYVGKRNSSQQDMRNIPATFSYKKLSSALPPMKTHFFWLRLESIRRSKLRLGKPANSTDNVLDEVSALLDADDNDKNWAVIGRGSDSMMQDIVRLEGSNLMECLNKFPKWGENVRELGFLGALRHALEPSVLPEPCGHFDVTLPGKEQGEGGEVCGKCKHPMKKFVVYK